MKQMICYGDSNTYGYDPASPFGGRYPAEVRWTGRVRRAGWDVLNAGMNGREIPLRDWEREEAVRAMEAAGDAALAVVMLGTNDLLKTRELTAEDAAERMETFLRYLLAHTALESGRLLLVAPPPLRPGTWVNEARLPAESARLGACYASLARELGTGFADAGAWGVELTFDGVHFTAAGHAAFAAGLLRCLSRTDLAPENAEECP